MLAFVSLDSFQKWVMAKAYVHVIYLNAIIL